MISPLASAVLISWSRNGAYGLRLVGDLQPEQFAAQPVAGVRMNHPAWILCHLNLYAPIAVALLTGRSFDDPAEHRYGAKSEVSDDPAEYPPGPILVREWEQLHDEGAKALEHATDEVLAAANPLERWRAMHPTVGDMVTTLMVKHESMHLGQLSAWRRAMGMARVAM